MRRQHFARALLLLLVGIAGCSSTSGSKVGSKMPARSIPVVGDRTLPASVGDPGEQVAAEVAEPEPRRNPLARISGRVVDDRGRPVPDATVRLADGGQQRGRDSRTTTDRSGAFTLGGLRPGSDYVIVAEGENDGVTMTGRARAKTADTGVIINLSVDDESASARRPASRGPRTRPISTKDPAGEPADERTSGVNSDDLVLPGDEPVEEAQPARKATSGTAQLSAPISTPGWRKGGSAGKPSDRGESDDESSQTQAPTRQQRPGENLPMDDDGPNPLPPAIEPSAARDVQASIAQPDENGFDPPSSRPGRTKTKPGALSLAAASLPTEDETPARRNRSAKRAAALSDGMIAMPAMDADELTTTPLASVSEPPSAQSMEPDPGMTRGQDPASTEVNLDVAESDLRPPASVAGGGPPPTAPLVQEESKIHPASGPVFASQGVSDSTPEPEPDAPYDPFALAATSTAAIAARPETRTPALEPGVAEPSEAPEASSPSPTPTPKKWGDLADRDRPKIAVEPTKASSPGLLRRLRGTPSTPPKAGPVMLCDYDARHRKVTDFQLPDLEGKPVRLHDLDADYVLLDFWGTWCKPCLDSIPRLVELQKKYGPSKLRVVGIACEQPTGGDKVARVDEFTRRLGINYTVLLSNMDGTCPVQNALQVQVYPTMVLLDRTGQILWRDRGATPATLERLESVLKSRSSASMARR